MYKTNSLKFEKGLYCDQICVTIAAYLHDKPYTVLRKRKAHNPNLPKYRVYFSSRILIKILFKAEHLGFVIGFFHHYKLPNSWEKLKSFCANFLQGSPTIRKIKTKIKIRLALLKQPLAYLITEVQKNSNKGWKTW